MPMTAVRGVIIILIIWLVGGSYFLVRQNIDQQQLATEWELKTLELERENDYLTRQLANERERNNTFSSQIDEISSTVNVLEKLRRIDPELLRKYSKIYFLNENYIPASLTKISSRYLYRPENEEKIQTDIWPYLRELLRAADNDDIDLKIISAYRSFFEQYNLKTNYKVIYGSGANQFSADQGYSEHQLGAALDFTTGAVTPTTLEFEQSKAYTWLINNAYKYGFILSYPKGNTYYQFEPWHWRFVGKDLAGDLHRRGQNFYDLDQREINESLVNLFD
ncbi:MAG: M15 family metallopeptidase [Candidatus Vogelbacteria bacterium]|nr:M15 family metallopeptidase [Candidatus Vogelbacteria bacterium]